MCKSGKSGKSGTIFTVRESAPKHLLFCRRLRFSPFPPQKMRYLIAKNMQGDACIFLSGMQIYFWLTQGL